jgi:hypothetical protein
MSYSFSVQQPSKASASSAVAHKLDEIVASQAVHEHDRAAAQATADTVLGFVREPGDGEVLSVNVSGWLSWQAQDPAPGDFTGACVNVSVNVLKAPEPAAAAAA